MGKRRRSREIILKLLYHKELNDLSADVILENYWAEQTCQEDVVEFVERVFRGVANKEKDLDVLIAKYSLNWDLDRLSIVDKCILRFGCYELIFMPDIPPNVSINEAIDIAKKYSQDESGKFINGILDKISKKESSKDV